MRRGQLSDYFDGIVVKRLTLVETVTKKSNQHEFQGTRPLKRLLGEEDRRQIPARFIRIADGEAAVSEKGFMSWSNVRKDKPRAAEYHLYYSGNSVTEAMQIGDILFLAQERSGNLLAVIAPGESTIVNQLHWLFGVDDLLDAAITYKEIEGGKSTELNFTARYILDELGIEPPEPEAELLDRLVEPFGLVFPKTRVFSDLARASLPDVSAHDDPDQALVAWMDREEQLFRQLERRVVAKRISEGFQSDGRADVDGFIAFSLSVQNRRKARVGQALENHLEAVFQANSVRYARGAETENRNKPDFLFPGQAEYRDPAYPAARLTMLGAKSTVKDRWRQVLSEAARIETKHLLTLEPAVSENQTNEMQAKLLQLVVPAPLHPTYRQNQRDWLMGLKEFIELAAARQ